MARFRLLQLPLGTCKVSYEEGIEEAARLSQVALAELADAVGDGWSVDQSLGIVWMQVYLNERPKIVTTTGYVHLPMLAGEHAVSMLLLRKD